MSFVLSSFNFLIKRSSDSFSEGGGMQEKVKQGRAILHDLGNRHVGGSSFPLKASTRNCPHLFLLLSGDPLLPTTSRGGGTSASRLLFIGLARS